jgi:hypothetical protein
MCFKERMDCVREQNDKQNNGRTNRTIDVRKLDRVGSSAQHPCGTFLINYLSYISNA